MNIFEYATKNKLRFSYKGSITTEDLWDLGINSLNDIYTTLAKQKKDTDVDSLLSMATSKNAELDVKMEIVKYIFTVKQEEAIQKTEEARRREEREHILSIIAHKQNEALNDLSIEELTKKLNDLQ